MEQSIIIAGYDIRYLEFIVALVGMIATILIAVFAGRIAYLQTNGKRPLLILRSQRFDLNSIQSGYVVVTLTYQAWNRRTYPIRVDGPRIVFNNAVLLPSENRADDKVIMTGRRAHSTERDVVLDRGAMKEFETKFSVKCPSIETFKEAYHVRVPMYDPMAWWTKRTLYSSGLLYPSHAFRQPVKSAMKAVLSRFWYIHRWFERDDWFEQGGRDGIKSEEVFRKWKQRFGPNNNTPQ